MNWNTSRSISSLFRLLELLDPHLIPTQRLGEFFDGTFGPSTSTIGCAGNTNHGEASDASVGAEVQEEVDSDLKNTVTELKLAEIPWKWNDAPGTFF